MPGPAPIRGGTPPKVTDLHIIWMTTGLGCDGDTVSITAAMQPSIEDIVMGAFPGLPKVHLHNPVLAYEVGDDFMKYWYAAERGELDPFVLVLEGSVPNESIEGEGLLGGDGHQPLTDRSGPSPPNEWIDRLASRRWPSWPAAPAPPTAASMRMEGNPTGA